MVSTIVSSMEIVNLETTYHISQYMKQECESGEERVILRIPMMTMK